MLRAARLSPPEIDPETVRRLRLLWAEAFGSEPVAVRDVIERSLANPRLFAVLADLVPGFAAHPHPEYLRDWLRRSENRPLPAHPLPGHRQHVRFTLVGHRWALVPLALPMPMPMPPGRRAADRDTRTSASQPLTTG